MQLVYSFRKRTRVQPIGMKKKFNIDNQRNKLPFTCNLNSLFNDEFMLLEKDPYAESVRRKMSDSLKKCHVALCLLYSHQLPWVL